MCIMESYIYAAGNGGRYGSAPIPKMMSRPGSQETGAAAAAGRSSAAAGCAAAAGARPESSPCGRCRKADPAVCEDLHCPAWRRWYSASWERARRLWLPTPAQLPEPDPCDDCVFPRELCAMPCAKRRAWEQEVR